MGVEAGVRLLVWDDPDLRRGETAVRVGEGTGQEADLAPLYLWLADRCAPTERCEAFVCLTVEPGSEAAATARVTALRRQGFAVHVQPPAVGASSLHETVAAIVEDTAAGGAPAEVVIASHDAAGLGVLLASLTARGVPVTLLCFRELAGSLAGTPGVTLVDPEAVPGLYPHPLPRTNLYDLPPRGRTLPPLLRPVRRPDAGHATVPQPTPDPADAAVHGAATPSEPTPTGYAQVDAAPTGYAQSEAAPAGPAPVDAAPVAPWQVVPVEAAAADPTPTEAVPAFPPAVPPAVPPAMPPAWPTPVADAPPAVPAVEPVAPATRKPVAPWQTVPVAPPAANGTAAPPADGPQHRLNPPPVT